MSGFIEEFYFGNLDPQSRITSVNKQLQKDLKVMSDTEVLLSDKLSGEETPCF